MAFRVVIAFGVYAGVDDKSVDGEGARKQSQSRGVRAIPKAIKPGLTSSKLPLRNA